MTEVLSIISSVFGIISGIIPGIITIIKLVKKYLFKIEVPEPETGTTEFRELIPPPFSEPIRYEPDINMPKNLDIHKILDSADEIASEIAKERGVSKEDVTAKEIRNYKRE